MNGQNERRLKAREKVLSVYPNATEMPDPSGMPSSDYCIVRPATKEDWPENRWVQIGPYVSGDPWEAAVYHIAEEEVKKKWPSARTCGSDKSTMIASFAVYIGPHSFGRRRKSDWCMSAREAWLNAAAKLGVGSVR